MAQFQHLMQAREIHRRGNLQGQTAHHGTTDDARQHRQHGQQRQRQYQGQGARHHQHVDRIHAQGTDGIDLLTRLHRTQLRGEGAARTPGHHDRYQKHAEFTQKGNGDQINGVEGGAKITQDGGSQKGHHGPDQKSQQDDDGNRVQAGLLHLHYPGCQAPATRIDEHTRQDRQQQAQKAEQLHTALPDRRYGGTNFGDEIAQTLATTRRRRPGIDLGHRSQQALMGGRQIS